MAYAVSSQPRASSKRPSVGGGGGRRSRNSQNSSSARMRLQSAVASTSHELRALQTPRQPPTLPASPRMGDGTPPRARQPETPAVGVWARTLSSRGADQHVPPSRGAPPPPPPIAKFVAVGQAEARESIQNLFKAIEKRSLMKGPCAKVFRQFWAFNFHPQERWKLNWDLLILFLVIFSSWWEPFNVSFMSEGTKMQHWEWAVDIFFYVDIAVKFFTGYDKGFEIIFDREEIARQYVWPGGPGWFFIDVMATVEWDQLYTVTIGGGETALQGGGKMIKMFRLLKVARLARMERLLDAYTSSWTIHTQYVAAIKFSIYVLIAAHILACFFFLIPEITMDKTCALINGTEDCANCDLDGTTCFYLDSWRTVYELDVPCGGVVPCGESAPHLFSHSTVWNQYVKSLYWSLTTMTTIGYGDFGPISQSEIIFTMIAEVVGLAVFALLLNQIAVIKEVVGRQQKEHAETKNEIVGFLKHIELETSLIQEVVQFLNFKAKGHSGHKLNNDGPIKMDSLSLPLRERVKQEIFTKNLEKVRFFGHSKEDEHERRTLRVTFDNIDKDGGGTLDKEEIRTLMEDLLQQDKESSREQQLDDATLNQAMAEMQGMSEGEKEPGNTPPNSDSDSVVDFEEFQNWWYLKTHNRPKLPKCPKMFLRQLASYMSDTLAPHGKRELIVGHGSYVGEDNDDEKYETAAGAFGNFYGDEMWLVLTGTVVVIKSLPRDNDVVKARFKWGKKLSVKGRCLCHESDPKGTVVAGSINKTERTCVVENEQYGKSKYRIAELVVVERAVPHHTVVGQKGQSLFLRKDATLQYGSDNCVVKLEPGQTLTAVEGDEKIKLATQGDKQKKINEDYFAKVQAFTDEGLFTGFVKRDSISSTGREKYDCDVNCLGDFEEITPACRTVGQNDEEPIFGLAACLDPGEHTLVNSLAKDWFVETMDFVDLAYITRAQLRTILERYWPALSANARRLQDETNAAHTVDADEISAADKVLRDKSEDFEGGQSALRKLALMDHGLDYHSPSAEAQERKKSAADAAMAPSQKWSVALQALHMHSSTLSAATEAPPAIRRLQDCEARFERIEENQSQMKDELMAQLKRIENMLLHASPAPASPGAVSPAKLGSPAEAVTVRSEGGGGYQQFPGSPEL